MSFMDGSSWLFLAYLKTKVISELVEYVFIALPLKPEFIYDIK